MKRKMKNIFKRVLAATCAAAMVLTGVLSDIGTLKVQAAGEHTLWIVGDSTVCVHNDTTYYYPRDGYGNQIGNYLDDTYTVQNLALSGRSSLSYLSDSNYTTLTSGIKAGDTLVVGFGHNDEKADDATRYTSPSADYTADGTFAKSLYDNYIKVAQDAGAEVILCTPIVRRTANDTWSDGNVHIANGGDYAQVIRDLGSALSIPVVDLTTLTKDLYTSLGSSETLYLHAWTSSKDASVDNTHLNAYGAKMVAWMFANAVDDTAAALGEHVDLTAGEPVKATDLVVNPDYSEPVYDGTLTDSELFEDYVVGDVHFKGTAFGSLNGSPNTDNYKLETDSNGDMRVAALNNKGKLSSTEEGLVMYYYKVPATSTFSLSAKATINAFDTNGQVGFGLTARDGVAIDLYDKTFVTDHVTAGTLGSGKNCFYRKNGVWGTGSALSVETLAAGSSYNLSIVGTADGYTCTFGNETPQSAGYDFPLTSYDSDYVYVGMFASRNADITYSNIHLVVDGETIVDTRKTEHNITVADAENGTVKANASTAAAGATVKLTATPADGYYFKEWQVTDASGAVTVTDDSFVMPAGDVEVNAVFEAYRYSWNFRSGSELMGADNGVCLQSTTDTFAGLSIDTTTGKFDTKNRTDWAQVNPGTVITIPVEGSCYVSVGLYSGSSITIDDGETLTSTSGEAVKQLCEGKDGEVKITVVGSNTYFGSITVTPYAEVPAGTTSFANASAGAKFDGIFLNNIDGYDNSHGLYSMGTSATMVLTLSEKANVIVESCCFGAGTNGTMTASSGTVTTAEVTEGSSSAPVFTVTGADAGELTLTFTTNGMWLHSVFVEYVPEVGPRNIDVWDFGAKVETDTETYTNNITPQVYIDAGVNKTFPGNLVVGDLTLTVNGTSDRLYTTVEELANYTYGNFGAGTKDYGDGYTSAGCYYANGTGGAGRRHVTIANVQAGDKIVVYAGMHGSAGSIFTFEGIGSSNKAQKDTVEVGLSEYKKMEFVAEYTGTYKVWENATGKPLFHRVMRVPGVAVSGTISAADVDGKYTGTGHTLKFVNNTTKQETEAVIDGNNFTATLAPGYEYTAVLGGAIGFGFTTDSCIITTTDAESLTGKTGVSLVIEPKETYTYSGKITGFATGYDVSKLAITMIAPEDSNLLDADVTIDADLNFSVRLEPDVKYTTQMTGVNDYEVKSDLVISQNKNYNADIQVGLKAMYEAKGGFIGLAEGASVSALSFENVDDKYTYAATVTADGYSINLRDGAYQAKATIDGYSTITHVVVDGAAVTKDIMFVSTAAAGSLDRVSDIYVGYPDKAYNYETVTEAVAACKAMNPTSEEQRITVHIAPGTYREQVIVEAPYISFVNDTDEEVKITWYYAIGYHYYSIDSTGYYNPENAYDQYEKGNPANWGTAVFVKKTATAFRAENIVFENSFNYYITDEEIADGAAPSGKEAIKVERKYGMDVAAKTSKERASAMVINADQVEFKNCTFLGSQDTLMTGNGDYNVYFKNCLIEGQTDYIYGDSSVIFDACELSWKGYSDGSTGGYITAAKPTNGNAYWFRNCVVTANDELTVAPGYFGRPWGAEAKVWFDNTKLESKDLIAAEGWYKMSVEPEAANFYEYNTTDLEGNAVNTTSRRGKVADETTAATWTMAALYGDWVPYYYETEEATVAFATAPYITDNGDINAPYPGHTLTVGYSLGEANDANDASRIDWYRVKAGAEDVLVKTSYATVDKTYKIASEDIGYQIKVVVTPITVSNNKGEAASQIVEEAVRDGYDDPDASNGDVALGDGVNIFLVGDSTVKDYSAQGMHSGGKTKPEGSWGEFFHDFFDEEKVTVVNYANGGRSTRNFINEGSLDKVAAQIGEGDYMFIQFGHNDCANQAAYLVDRHAPLGTPDANGIFPVTAGVKNDEGKYTYDCGGTFKWYLLQYINVAREAGAIPVLVTPVARMYYDSEGNIRPHHDSTDTSAGTYVSSNNAYVTAYKQLAEEENVLLIDGFEITKKLFEDAYDACGSKAYGAQTMYVGDSTHSSKLGGLIEAAALAQVVQNMELNISYAVKAPTQVLGESHDGKTAFTVSGSSVLSAWDITTEYVDRAPYWEGVGQTMFDAMAAKADELAGSGSGSGSGSGGEETPVDTTALKEAIAAAEALDEAHYTEATWAAVEAAQAAAEAELNNAASTAESVAAAAKALNDAVAALEKKTVEEATEDLKEEIKTTTTLVQGEYTAATWAKYELALAAAYAELNNASATVESIAAAQKALNDAIAALTKQPVDSGSGPEESDDDEDSAAEGGAATAPRTGDKTPVGAMVVVLVLALGAAVALILKKKEV